VITCDEKTVGASPSILGTGIESLLVNLIRRPSLEVNARAQIIGTNAAARDFLGFDAEEDRGVPLETLGSEELLRTVARALRSPGTEVGLTTAVRDRNRVERPVRCDGVTFLTSAGSEGALLILTDLRPLVAEGTERTRELCLIGLAVASSAHEIKNTLNGIEGGTALIHMGLGQERPELVRKGWALTERRLTLLKNLVSDLLALSREGPLLFFEASLGQAAEEAAREMEAQALASETRICLTVEPGLPPFRFCKKAIQQCAINLLSNAICACSTLPPGRERRVEIRAGRAGAGRFSLVVADTGPGIPREQVPRILEGFKSTKGSGGTGLGLQVVQKLARAHGGQLEVGGQEGEGAVFTMVLPRDPTP